MHLEPRVGCASLRPGTSAHSSRPFPSRASSVIARASRLVPRQTVQRVTQPDQTDQTDHTDQTESSTLSCRLNKLTRRPRVTHQQEPKQILQLNPTTAGSETGCSPAATDHGWFELAMERKVLRNETGICHRPGLRTNQDCGQMAQRRRRVRIVGTPSSWQAPGAWTGCLVRSCPATPIGVTTSLSLDGRLGGFDHGTWTASPRHGQGRCRVRSGQSLPETSTKGRRTFQERGTHGLRYFHHLRTLETEVSGHLLVPGRWRWQHTPDEEDWGFVMQKGDCGQARRKR